MVAGGGLLGGSGAMVRSILAKGVAAAALAAAVMAFPGSGAGQDIRFLRIGTGSISGVYFPIGGLIASAVSNPPGARACSEGGACGVPGLIAVAQATTGSVANVRAIGDGALETALVQADVAHFAREGMGAFAGGRRIPELRAIANLYPEAVHIVVRADSPITRIEHLSGRRVSLDLAGSGTREVARLVLEGHGIDPASVRQVNSQLGPAVDRIRLGRIDAFFFVGGFPVGALAGLAREMPLRLLPISGERAAAIRRKDPFLTEARIPAQTYHGVAPVDTLAVGALWVVSEKVDAGIVYGITQALWHSSTRRLLEQGHPVARQMRLDNALKGLAIPLHVGAERYYREEGLIKDRVPPAAEPRPAGR